MRGVRTHWRLLALGAVAAAAVAFAVLAWHGANQKHHELADRQSALNAAQTRLPLLLSYDYATLKQDLVRSQDQATGQFQTDYSQLLNEVVRSTASSRHVSTTATLTGAGVISAQGADVVILAFLSQRATAPGVAASVISSEVDVTMRRVGDTWKIANLLPHR